MVDSYEEKDIKTEPPNDGGGNNNANDGRLLSPSPGSSASSAGSNKSVAGAPEDQQTLLAVLQFLRKNKLTESVEILRREAGLPEDSLDLKGGDSSGAGSGGAAGGVDLESGDASALLSRVTVSSSAAAQAPTKAPGEDQPDVNVVLSAYSQQGDPALYGVYYSGLKKFIESVLDCHRAELSQVFYPLFVHMYLELVYNNHENEAKVFFEKFSGDQECYYEDDLRILSSLTKKEHMRGNETLLDFRTSKFVLRISRDSYQLLKRHLQERQNNQIWNIIQEHLYIDIFDGMPRSKSQIDAMSGSLAGEAKREGQ
ncbi:Transcription initiation factor TFIID subunit 5 [Larimichthys crocea]|uniref:Transcription initiation factor TFIID subunit 5 n=1 Tax=Larimichthys crocea TaxID=215358 RepID=A0A6G0JBJ0_LARCR|nr:Transcription initiation factor TFIID subunit 5 [Larimichthys crocea]